MLDVKLMLLSLLVMVFLYIEKKNPKKISKDVRTVGFLIVRITLFLWFLELIGPFLNLF